jgi:ABC-type amino acid transport substrate-binding protein
MKTLYTLFLILEFLINFSSNAKKLVLVGAYQPLIVCDLEAEHIPQEDYKGVDIEFFKDIVSELGWSMSDFEFKCMGYWDTFGELATNPDAFCVINGLTMSEYLLEDGFKFSQPYYTTGASVMIRATTDHWGFAGVYGIDVLLTLLVVNLLVVAPIVQQFEERTFPLPYYMWHEMSRVEFKCISTNQSYSAKMVTVVQAFIILVLVQAFEAFMVMNQTLQDRILTQADISGRSVGSWIDYAGQIEGFGGTFVNVEVQTPQDVAAFIYNSSLIFDGVLYDDVMLEVTQFLYPDLYISITGLYEFGTGVLFNGTADDDIINQISEAIEAVNAVYPYKQRVTDFITSYYPPLKTYTGTKDPLIWNSFTFQYFLPVWIVYLVCLVLGIIVGFRAIFKKWINQKQEQKKLMKSMTTRSTQKNEKTVNRAKKRMTSLVKASKKPVSEAAKGVLQTRIDLAFVKLAKLRNSKASIQHFSGASTLILSEHQTMSDALMNRVVDSQHSLFKYATNYKATLRLRQQPHYDVRGGKEAEIKKGMIRLLEKYHLGQDKKLENQRRDISLRVWGVLNKLAGNWAEALANEHQVTTFPTQMSMSRPANLMSITNGPESVQLKSMKKSKSLLGQVSWG